MKKTKVNQIASKVLTSARKNSTINLTAGSTFSLKDFKKHFKHIYPGLKDVNTHSSHELTVKEGAIIASAYSGVNAVLAQKGMAIKAKNYYSEFHILGAGDTIDRTVATSNAEAVTAKVTSLQAKAKRAYDYSITLAKGVTTHNCEFTSPLSETEAKEAAKNVMPRMMYRSYGN